METMRKHWVSALRDVQLLPYQWQRPHAGDSVMSDVEATPPSGESGCNVCRELFDKAAPIVGQPPAGIDHQRGGNACRVGRSLCVCGKPEEALMGS